MLTSYVNTIFFTHKLCFAYTLKEHDEKHNTREIPGDECKISKTYLYTRGRDDDDNDEDDILVDGKKANIVALGDWLSNNLFKSKYCNLLSIQFLNL